MSEKPFDDNSHRVWVRQAEGASLRSSRGSHQSQEHAELYLGAHWPAGKRSPGQVFSTASNSGAYQRRSPVHSRAEREEAHELPGLVTPVAAHLVD